MDLDFRWAAWSGKQFAETLLQFGWILPPQASVEDIAMECHMIRISGFVISLGDRKHYNPDTIGFVQIPKGMKDAVGYLTQKLLMFITNALKTETSDVWAMHKVVLRWDPCLPSAIADFFVAAFEKNGINLGASMIKWDDTPTPGVLVTGIFDRIFLQPLKSSCEQHADGIHMPVPAWLSNVNPILETDATPSRKRKTAVYTGPTMPRKLVPPGEAIME